jgi:hypothetical protein
MITPTLLARIGEAVLLDPRASVLRQHYPQLHFTECSEDDVSPRYKPAFAVEGYDLYLVSGASGHCLEFTSDHDAATGIVIAAKVDDE